MHTDGAAFLREEREAWQPYAALGALSDEALERPCAGAHGWSGRDLAAHLVEWHVVTAVIARELAAGSSTTLDRDLALDDAAVDAMNAKTIASWRSLPLAEVRARFATIPDELRAALAALPDERWLRDEHAYQWMIWNTLDHYAGHAADLNAILGAR